MNVFDNNKFYTARKQYEAEAKERWGKTDAYKEHELKTVDYSRDKWQQVNDGLSVVLAEFAVCLQSGQTPDSNEAQALVKELQSYITENYYTCENDILKGLGQMYVGDERFKENIDKHATGTAQFISEAIEIYCE